MANLLDGLLPDLVADLFPALTGQAVTVRTTTDTSDPETGTEGVRTATDQVVTSLDPLGSYAIQLINGQSILTGDAQISIAAAALTTVPTPHATTLVIESVEWRVVDVQPLRSGDRTILYTFQLRQ
jgi:hypothetical protein